MSPQLDLSFLLLDRRQVLKEDERLSSVRSISDTVSVILLLYTTAADLK